MITEAKNKLIKGKKKPKATKASILKRRYQTHENKKSGLSFEEVLGYKKG